MDLITIIFWLTTAFLVGWGLGHSLKAYKSLIEKAT